MSRLFLAPTGAQEVLIFVPYHRLLHKLSPYHCLLMGQVSFNLIFTYESSKGGDMSHLKVVI